jgi:hypothetical protein
MKYKFLTLVLAIFLTGQYTLAQLSVAKKYDNFIGPDIEISVTDKPGNLHGIKNCNTDEVVRGCTYITKSGKFIDPEIKNEPDLAIFESTMIHEATHIIFKSKDEKRVSTITKLIIDWINNLK